MTTPADAPEVDVQPLGEFLGQLAARLPAPGAGATAAIEAALAASLVAMVGRFTSGDGYAEHRDVVAAVIAQADAVRTTCLAAAAADETAFTAVTEAYRLPQDTPEEQETRRAAVHAAQVEAAQPPRDVIEAAAALLPLAEQLLPIANPNVVSDVAAATAAARAAATTARLAVEVNLRGITDDAARADLSTVVDRVEELIRRADAVEATVRERLAR
ncbi:cyclodeaminase/cyclohydrolase family protein [Modestobacter roseus]|nr:cyclodeaminase/cyclohydrolase family protein [Modestobacter roseus]MQA32021.1 formimidoyltetrahydrofolate cyclodeaminase [Modestobacter roseus]